MVTESVVVQKRDLVTNPTLDQSLKDAKLTVVRFQFQILTSNSCIISGVSDRSNRGTATPSKSLKTKTWWLILSLQSATWIWWWSLFFGSCIIVKSRFLATGHQLDDGQLKASNWPDTVEIATGEVLQLIKSLPLFSGVEAPGWIQLVQSFVNLSPPPANSAALNQSFRGASKLLTPFYNPWGKEQTHSHIENVQANNQIKTRRSDSTRVAMRRFSCSMVYRPLL